MAIRPLSSVRLLRKIMVWLVLAASVFLFVQVLLQPRQSIPQESVLGFWPAVDLAVAGVISFGAAGSGLQPTLANSEGRLLGSLSRLRPRRRRTITPSASSQCLNLGASDVITALVTLPAGAIAITILLVDEVDEAFANVYSTTMSVHNIVPQLDRRFVALVIGVTGDLAGRLAQLWPVPVLPVPDRLSLRAAVRRRGGGLLPGQPPALGCLCPPSRLRVTPVIAWACGFAAYQMVQPGTVAGLGRFLGWVYASIGFLPPSWLGSSVAAIAVGGLVMFISGLLVRYRQDARQPNTLTRVSAEDMTSEPVLIAHRGFSSRHPEMTKAAYQAAIEWAYETEIPLGLECDVHFSADDELIFLPTRSDLGPDLYHLGTGVRAHGRATQAGGFRLSERARSRT